MAAFTLISRAIEFVAAQRGISEAEAWAIIKKDIWEGDLPAAGRVDEGYLVKFHPSWINYLCNFLDAEQQPRSASYDPSDQIVAHIGREENLKHTDFPHDDFVCFDCKAALLDRKLRKAKGDNVGPPAPPTRLSHFSVAETRLRALYGADLAGPVTISTSCRTVCWPSGIDRLQVDEAAKLLQPAYPTAPIANVNDSKLRGELIKVARECDIRADIIRAGQNGQIQLVHPTLGISYGIVPEPDWFIGAQEFARFAETFGILVVGADGAQIAASGDTDIISTTSTGMLGRPSKGKNLIEDELKRAGDNQIDQAIAAEYDAAEMKSSKPPNIKEIVKPVLRRLSEVGYIATGVQIERVAGADRHKKRRRPVGKTVASEKSH
jgi:hypothetical protein